jgi:DegV family protein with EDD domain
MQKICIMTDSASDIPRKIAEELGIIVMPIPITHAGKSYHERVELTNEQFYELIQGSSEIPSTSHITSDTYLTEYKKAYESGCTHLLNVTINSLGSSMFDSACLAKRMFYEENPASEESFRIEVLDSRTYTMAYGIAVINAAKMAKNGEELDTIIVSLKDWFSRLEIIFSVYSLDFVKKSGRVPAAAVFVGDLLGLRPMIAFINGVASIIDKARGDRNVVPKILEVARRRMRGAENYPFLMICGTPVKEAAQLEELINDTMPQMKFEGIFPVGASVAINCGPKVVALVYAGEKRGE